MRQVRSSQRPLDRHTNSMNVKVDMSVDDPDDRVLVELAKAVFIAERRVSVSLMQRHLMLGYRRAFSIMIKLERLGVVTEPNAANVRSLTPEYSPR